MIRSENISELATALSKAQGEIETASKDSVNPHFKSSYADLASVWDACRAPLSKNGLSVVQTMEQKQAGADADSKPLIKTFLVTTLLHSTGQFISSEITLNPEKLTPQGIGSCITYMRRYSLMAIVGIAPEEDDGEGAENNESPTNIKQPTEVKQARRG